ncbi:twin-arginine translocase subunit TatC [Vulgatibacter incomptus]|uniref:Sec-independent protein translocase protein TatC n=1 Tax=Vulgatibacter incomptus TaxID=1391653 RepID=A0A0K1PEE8_9BACT|nr:twin-arginine translocase subunit TatC [Vulgatibacter incomptus]AKU91499.1 Twin-arginine translocation protein TatC [Vulgatibacter incomptus]
MRRDPDLRLSLLDHLGELRSRLIRASIAVVVLAGIALNFSKELFHILVIPILRALPEGQRALVQTSAIEELNTFIKVGLYAGLFLSAPVILYQLWGFVAPGLYANERRMAVPFVVAGTGCFIGGVVFCYFAILPPAFEFLLQPEDIRDRSVELKLAKGSMEDAGMLLRAGDPSNASRLLDQVDGHLAELPAVSRGGSQALLERIEHLSPALDVAERAADRSAAARVELSAAILSRSEARSLAIRGETGRAEELLARADEELRRAITSGAGPEKTAQLREVLDHHTSTSARLAAASEQHSMDDWTRPMLSMREQLDLVLLLLLAFGVIFEIPVIFALLASIGLIDGSELAKFRRYAIVINVIIAAVLTPTGDPFNLALMSIPMILFYEIGIIAARLISRRRKAREAAALAA